MGLLSTTTGITRYQVKGELKDNFMSLIDKGLKQFSVKEIDNEPLEVSVGWTSFEHPFEAHFEHSNFTIGTYLIFCMRIDKKRIPPKAIQKHAAIEIKKRLTKSGREFLTRAEKADIKEKIKLKLCIRTPATPSIYEVVWNYEEKVLFFLNCQKAANEELETLFSKSFKLQLIRLFPYTIADLNLNLSSAKMDRLNQLSPSRFRK